MTNKKPLLTVYEQTKVIDAVKRLNIQNSLEEDIAFIEAGAEAYARKMERPACKACFTNENGDDSRELCFKCEENIRQEERSKLSSPELREKIDKILWQPIEWIQASKGGDMLPNGKLPYYLATNYKDKKVDEILSLIKQDN